VGGPSPATDDECDIGTDRSRWVSLSMHLPIAERFA